MFPATLRRLIPALVLFALLGLTFPLARHAHADSEPEKFTINVTDTGFDPATIEVDQDATVEITFVWDQASYPDDVHIIIFKDFKVESQQIDTEHRETTVRLVANQSGTFTFKCDVECDAHDYLQAGKLVIKPSGSGGSGGGSGLVPTEMVVQPSSVAIEGDAVSVLTQLIDDEGNPIPKADLRFMVEETFVGTTSFVEVGAAQTNDTGFARFSYKPTHTEPANLVVQFDGAGVYDATQLNVQVPGSNSFHPVQLDEHESAATLRSWAPTGLVVLFLSVWSVLGFALYKAWSMSRIREEGGGPGTT